MSVTTSDAGPNLTKVTYAGRLLVKYGSIALVVLMVGRVVLSAAYTYWKATHPDPPPAPTVGFGLLPFPQFPEKNDDEKPSAYKLETPTGGTPEFGDRAKVFLMPKNEPSLLADERVKEVAEQYGFKAEPQVLSSRLYRWTKSEPLESALEVDLENLDVRLSTNYMSRPDLPANSQLPAAFEAVARVKGFMTASDLLPADIATVAGEVTLLKLLGTELQPAVSISDADYVRVDINRNPIDGLYSLVTPEGKTGVIQAIISGAFSGNQSLVSFVDAHHEVDYTQVHTYPIRSSVSAWKLLQAGEGYIAQKGTSDTAIVRQVELAYYETPEEQEYLQPVYVFIGDGGFLGYVPAIDPLWLSSTPTPRQ